MLKKCLALAYSSFFPIFQPERIDLRKVKPGYDVRSDVWSLGITLMELATGCFPYPKWDNAFEQLSQVVEGDPPQLSPCENGNTFTMEFVDLVNTWYVNFYDVIWAVLI